MFCNLPLQSSSESSDDHHIPELIDQLDVDEDERPVTVIVMAANGEDGLSRYLLHLIAGHLTEPIVKSTDNLWKELQTHYIGNDSLYDEIRRNCGKCLGDIKPEKKEKILKNGPRFVVTSTFPIKSKTGDFMIPHLIEAKVEASAEDKDRDVYVYETEGKLKLRLHEPRSPMTGEYSSASGTVTKKITVPEVSTHFF